MSTPFRIFVFFALAGALAACHRNPETSVVGSAQFALMPSGTTAFNFAHETTLPNEATTTKVGTIAGHCKLGTDTVDVRVEVIGGVAEGVSWLDVKVFDGVATVEARVNNRIYAADCDQLQITTDPAGRTVQLAGSCPLLSTAPDTITLTSNLDFDACVRE